MKKKVLLSSVMTIELCLCLIAGSTFALFTDSTNFNIAVTSGDVEILATAGINAVYSAKGTDDDVAEDEYLKDENGHGYSHDPQKTVIDGRHYFKNGGYAVVDGANLVIDKITPGDRVDVTVKVENKSNVAMSYRYKIVAEDVNLAYGMVVSVGDNTEDPTKLLSDAELIGYEGLATWTSKWYPVIPIDYDSGKGKEIPDFVFSVELPVYAGNEYQSELTEDKEQSVSYTVIVEAVQGNAVTDDESAATVFPEALARRIAKGGDVNGHDAVVNLDDMIRISKDTTFSHIAMNSNEATRNAVVFCQGMGEIFNIVMDEGASLTTTGTNQKGIHMMSRDHNLTLKKGSKITVAGTNSYGVFVYENATFDLTLEEAGLIEVTGANSYGIVASDRYTVLNIHVPSVEVMNYYRNTPNMIYTTQGATINWIVGDKHVETVKTEAIVGNSEGTTYQGNIFTLGEIISDAFVLQKAALSNDAGISLKRVYGTVILEGVVADVNGNLITSETNNTIILQDCDIKLDAGEMLIVGTRIEQVMMHNVTVNGVLLTQETAAQYMQGVTTYQVW